MDISSSDVTDFSRRMADVGPFESMPHVAVAVSGGADSMALALLADRWARDHGGRATALTVDHGLRPGSAPEAEQVARWLSALGIEHHILTWPGDKPGAGIQAAARAARYRLMTKACRDAGILHLLTAHHQEDQAETFLLRLSRSSGIDGLAAMPTVLETGGIRLLRPLLDMPKERLRATLKAAGQDWVEDPSNDNRAFARIRIRQSLPGLAAAGISTAALTTTAAAMARARVALESTASALLGRCAFVHPTGYIRLDGRVLFDAPAEISLRALSRTLMCVGGGVYPPAMQKLENLHEKMKAQFLTPNGWKGATLARCRLTSSVAGGSVGAFYVWREMRNLPVPQPMPLKGEMYWDRRFDLRIHGPDNDPDSTEFDNYFNDLSIAPLGRVGLMEIRAGGDGTLLETVPNAALWTLPAVFDAAGLVQAPHLNYTHPRWNGRAGGIDRAAFFPAQSLSGAGFAMVPLLRNEFTALSIS